MVGLAVGTVAVVASGGVFGPVFAAGANAAITTGASVGSAGVVGGAMVGAAAGSAGVATLATAVGDATTGAASATAMTSAAAGILTGPVLWVVLGAAEDQSSGLYRFDCWKQVVHDDSCEPSNGRLLKDIITDSCIKQVLTISNNNEANLLNLVIENIWNEQFFIEYIYLEKTKQSAAHDTKIEQEK
ncbi:hypothetical protein I4U23_031169 [Adineta vaga]|nr:hypothetical protein I4U23_031169 [Adineta vaga]